MNTRITDARLLEIVESRDCPDLPAELCHLAYRAARKLLAARQWGDIFAPVAQFPDGHYAIHVHGKWVLAFQWGPGNGAWDMSLRRV